jgi:hypothetical protein
MDVEMARHRRIQMSVVSGASVAIIILTALAISDIVPRATQPGPTRAPTSVAPEIQAVTGAPWLLSRSEVRFLIRRGATSAELHAESQGRWNRVQRRMLHDPWVVGLLRHKPGVTIADLVASFAEDAVDRIPA